VRGKSAIGTILPCPKCGSMVQIVARPGSGANDDPKLAKPKTPPKLPPTPPQKSHSPPFLPPELVSNSCWSTPNELLYRKWLILVAGPISVFVVVIGIWSILSAKDKKTSPKEVLAEESLAPKATESAEEPAKPIDPPQAQPAIFDESIHWVPDNTCMYLSLPISQLSEMPGIERFGKHFSAICQSMANDIRYTFEMADGDIECLDCASTDLTNWPKRSVFLIRLKKTQNAEPLLAIGEEIDLSIRNIQFRQLRNADWQHPYAVLDPHTIVTGPLDILQSLVDRDSTSHGTTPIANLWKTASAEAHAKLLLDLSSARKAGWHLPKGLLEKFPTDRVAWNIIRQMPVGLAIEILLKDSLQSTLTLTCETETSAEQVHSAVVDLLSKQGLSTIPDTKCTLLKTSVRICTNWKHDTPALSNLLLDQARPAKSGEQPGTRQLANSPIPKIPESRPRIPTEIAKKLAAKIPEIDIQDGSLSNVVNLLGQLSSLNITFGEIARTTKNAKVCIHLSNATVAEILTKTLSSVGLTYHVNNSRLVITDRQ